MRTRHLVPLILPLLTGQTLAATTVQYILEVGGNNHASAWKNPPLDCQMPFFTSGITWDGSNQGCIVTWAARVSVTGTYSVDGLAPLGLANVVFDLELHEGGADGPLVLMGRGSPGIQGFFSTINDGTPNSGSCYQTPDPLEVAAFPVSFNVTWISSSWNGRLIDYATGEQNNAGGPGLTYSQYPSTYGFPAGSTCPAGTLCGMSAGYPGYIPNGCPDDCGSGPPGGFAMPGLGYSAANPMPACSSFQSGQGGLGDVAIMEGQINLSGLSGGTYTLALIPGAGTNLIRGGFPCNTDPGSFAVAAQTAGGDVVLGDTISFAHFGCPDVFPVRSVVGRHLFYNNSFYDSPSATCNNTFNNGVPCNDNTAVPSRIVALLPGQSPRVPSTDNGFTANYSSYTKGINGIMIDVQYDAFTSPLPHGALTPAGIAATFEFVETTGFGSGRAVDSPYTGAVRNPISVAIAPHPTLWDTDRITIIFADDTSTNSSWFRTRVLPGGLIDGLPGEDRFYFGLAKAESLTVSGTNAIVGNIDQDGPKSPFGHTFLNRAPIDDSYDYNRDSLVNNVDQDAAKSPNLTSFLTCLQLAGSAP